MPDAYAVLASTPLSIRLKLMWNATVATGCSAGVPDSGPESPEEGDIRLVPIDGTAAATAPCDDVHFGGLELFHAGQWGRICVGDFIPSAGPEPEDFAVDAQVACRELGFPFGTVMDTSEVDDSYNGQYGGGQAGFEQEVAWASRVSSTLKIRLQGH